MERKVVWGSPFRWVVPADYEDWLEDMARQGWHPEPVGQWSSLRMVFTRGEPQKMRYVYDMNAFPKADYVETYRQFGWEPVGQMASCFLWRRAYDGPRPEAFTDPASVRARNRRVRNAVVLVFVLFALEVAASIFGAGRNFIRGEWLDGLSFAGQVVLFGAFTVYLGWVVRQIQRNLNR